MNEIRKMKKKKKKKTVILEFKIKLEKEIISEEKEINYKIIIKMLIVKLFCFK